MSTIDLHRVHALTTPQAHAAVNAIATELAQELGIESRWEGDTLHFHRPGAKGTIHVSTNEVHFHVELSMLLHLLKSEIEAQVQRYFNQHFQQH